MANLDFNNVKTEVALEMISLYIGLEFKTNKELANKLIKERDAIYLGNNNLVDKVINEYGNELKNILG